MLLAVKLAAYLSRSILDTTTEAVYEQSANIAGSQHSLCDSSRRPTNTVQSSTAVQDRWMEMYRINDPLSQVSPTLPPAIHISTC